MTEDQVIARARRLKRIKDGLVLCDICDTPASRSVSVNALSWTACAPCCFGESDAFDPNDLIPVPTIKKGKIQ